MLEPNVNKEQDAFRNAAPGLSTFSLPSNLNDKLVANKQKQQQQQNIRPRLSKLRSTWLSQQSIEEDAFAEDTLIYIKLPPIPSVANSPRLGSEVNMVAMVAALLNLASCFCEPLGYKLRTLFLGQWLLILAWLALGSSKGILVYIRYSSLFMLAIASMTSLKITLLLPLLGSFLFYIAERLSNADQKLQVETISLLETQQTNVQKSIDTALGAYGARRGMYLSIVSQEIRDAALMAMATLEQFAPPSILCNTHELLSACSIAVPIAGISAINTTIKQACHITSHLNLLSRMLREADTHHVIPEKDRVKSFVNREFDMGELVQNVGDALAGISAKLGVHFVIYHTDNGLYYTNVIGDEDATKHVLINLLRNMLEGCTPGAVIELGLFIAPIPDTSKVKASFDIVQTASPAIPAGLSGAFIPNTKFTAQLLSYINGKMELEDLGKNRTRVEISFELFPGSNNEQKLLLIEKPSQILEKQLASVRFSNEPTLEDLNAFITMLKGVKLILHAPEKSIFAKHLTSCLTSWNTDISHLPVLSFADTETLDGTTFSDTTTTIGSDSDTISISSDIQQVKTTPPVNRTLNVNNDKKVPSPAIEEDHIHSIPPAFILIDDDILTLERKLREFREKPLIPPAQVLQQQQQQQQQQRRHRRSKSRTNDNAMMLQGVTIAVIFFISLTNYKRVRDIIQWFNTSNGSTFYVPRVVVVPKPAGPRRFLTALHTAWNNAIVEPQFMPIATSPLSPFIGHNHHFASPTTEPGSANPLLATPGPMMTPHDMNRFSPRRAPRGMHSPSGLQIESDKGNYFFDSVARPNTSATGSNTMGSAAAKTSPMLTAVANQQGLSTNIPLLNNNVSGVSTPGASSACGSNSSAGSSVAGTNPTPNEIKRRLRSHSNTFSTSNTGSSRRTLVDLSILQSPPTATTSTIGSPSSATSNQAMDGNDQEGVLSPTSLLKSKNIHISIQPNQTEDSTMNPSASVTESSSESLLSPLQKQATKKGLSPTSSIETMKNIDTKKTPSVPLDTKPLSPPPVQQTTKTGSPVKLKTKFNNDFKISNRKRKEKSSTKQSPPITVLIVEDNMINQAILSTWMKKHNIKFSVASDGKEAVEKWKGGGFHLILMDIQLPVMDGLEATKTIRAIEKERKIGVLPSNSDDEQEHYEQRVIDDDKVIALPAVSSSISSSTTTGFQSPVIIVALTASSLESDRHAALAAGCNDFLTKPVSLEWLEKKIMEWGCMQALIDFEGWRKWKRSTTTTKATKPVTTKETQQQQLQLQEEKKSLDLRTKALLKDESRVIVLLGINKRRMSTAFGDQDRSIANSSSNSKQTSPKQIRKRASDPDMYTKEMSIPKQVEARELKRLLAEERLFKQQQQLDDDRDDDDDDNDDNDSIIVEED